MLGQRVGDSHLIRTSTEIGYNGADLKSDVPVRACGFESYLVRQYTRVAELAYALR